MWESPTLECVNEICAAQTLVTYTRDLRWRQTLETYTRDRGPVFGLHRYRLGCTDSVDAFQCPAPRRTAVGPDGSLWESSTLECVKLPPQILEAWTKGCAISNTTFLVLTNWILILVEFVNFVSIVLHSIFRRLVIILSYISWCQALHLHHSFEYTNLQYLW
jgi:hypothetical protein